MKVLDLIRKLILMPMDHEIEVRRYNGRVTLSVISVLNDNAGVASHRGRRWEPQRDTVTLWCDKKESK